MSPELASEPNDGWLFVIYAVGLLAPCVAAIAARGSTALKLTIGLTLLVAIALAGLSYWSLHQPGADGLEGLIGVYGVLLTLSLLLGLAVRGLRTVFRRRAA